MDSETFLFTDTAEEQEYVISEVNFLTRAVSFIRNSRRANRPTRNPVYRDCYGAKDCLFATFCNENSIVAKDLWERVHQFEAHESGKVLNEEELEFLADLRVVEGSSYGQFVYYRSDVLSEYLLETQNAAVQDTNSSTQQDAMILSVFEQLSNQVTNCNKVNKDNLISNESLSDELERYKERVKLLEKRQNMDIWPMLYDGSVITKETNVISIVDSKETLMLEEESRSKMLLKQNFGKHFVPQQELSNEQAFRLQPSHPNTGHSLLHLSKLRLLENFLSIKNNLRKFKRKDIVDNAAQVSNDTTIAPGMYKLNQVTLAPKDKNNRETHIYYLKHTMEQVAILREIVKQANSLNPLDSASYFACKYVKLIQEFLGYVRDSFPDIHKPSEKLVVVTPINKKKIVRVSRSTKSSRLKSTDNTENDRILQISSSTQKKNKVKDHSRIVKSSLNNSNCVVEPSKNANVQHSKLNTNFKLMCVKCNSSMFDAGHELCFLEFVSDMNARSKSKSVKKLKRKKNGNLDEKCLLKLDITGDPQEGLSL
uniref:Uncharacterized protein n=1 Tax=Tanacetum cinerariifolium TaxID=118510 RepID=A0A6L2K409_TANCI|nr:hypothetical protein [Tanacetum cinerariifolium]